MFIPGRSTTWMPSSLRRCLWEVTSLNPLKRSARQYKTFQQCNHATLPGPEEEECTLTSCTSFTAAWKRGAHARHQKRRMKNENGAFEPKDGQITRHTAGGRYFEHCWSFLIYFLPIWWSVELGWGRNLRKLGCKTKLFQCIWKWSWNKAVPKVHRCAERVQSASRCW